MHRLEGPVEGGGGFIAIAQANLQHLLPHPQPLGRQRHPAPPQVFGQRHPCQVGKDALIVVDRATCNLRCARKVNFFFQVLLQIIQRLVQCQKPFHSHPLPSPLL